MGEAWFVILDDTTRFHVAEAEAMRVRRAVDEFEAGADPEELILTLLADENRPRISVADIVSVGPVKPHPRPRRD